MIAIEVRDGAYIVKASKCVLVLIKAQFSEALKRGKAYCRAQQCVARLAPNAASDPLAYEYHQRAGRTCRRVSPISPYFTVNADAGITAQAVSAVASLAQARKIVCFLSPGNRSVARLVRNRASSDRI